ncbi:GIY-YIG nuclease family protein [Patescibacteria group bacterium]|nr:GIY-YIG nuclease family protein [Patescibacteria group bacterium]MBU1891047.1 GIY-YIG nuclease family protein [Patescibacteria group bacterium]
MVVEIAPGLVLAPVAPATHGESGREMLEDYMYYVYILYSVKLSKKYIGRTNNLRRRVHDHIKGKTSFTSSAKDWKLVYYEVFQSKRDATAEELFLKTGKGRERLKYLLKHTLLKP